MHGQTPQGETPITYDLRGVLERARSIILALEALSYSIVTPKLEPRSSSPEWAEKESQDYSEFCKALEAQRRRDDKVKDSNGARLPSHTEPPPPFSVFLGSSQVFRVHDDTSQQGVQLPVYRIESNGAVAFQDTEVSEEKLRTTIQDSQLVPLGEDLTLIDSNVPAGSGIIDTFALDSQNRFVVIEYKAKRVPFLSCK